MQKVKVTLTSQTIVTIEAGTHEAVRDGGNLYVLIQQEDGMGEPEAPKKAPAKEAPAPAEVVDDTQAPAPAKKATAKKAPAKKEEAPAPAPARSARRTPEPEPEATEPELIPEENWGDLEIGTKVYAKLDMGEGGDNDKLWEAEIVGWDKPKGSKVEVLYVKFAEDGQEDYLREGDELYTFPSEEEGL